jgi:hypothetical protein
MILRHLLMKMYTTHVHVARHADNVNGNDAFEDDIPADLLRNSWYCVLPFYSVALLPKLVITVHHILREDAPCHAANANVL